MIPFLKISSRSGGSVTGLGIFLLLLAFSSPDSRGEEAPEPYRTLMVEAQAAAPRFVEVPVTTAPGEARWFDESLEQNALKIQGKHEFGLIRFTAPKEAGLDMVWSFAVSPFTDEWFIMPTKGEMRGFQNWYDADRLYAQLKTDREHPAQLQSLAADRLKPGGSYLLWFKLPPAAERGTGGVRIKGAISFQRRSKDAQGGEVEWDRDTIEKALGLKPAPAKQQAEYFGSKGANILLDRKFFEEGYAENRIRDLLTTTRRFRTFNDGYYIGMKISIPPCRSEPRIKDLLAAYGEADLVLGPADRKALGLEDNTDETVFYYDHFGFEVRMGDPDPRVLRVTAEASSAAVLRPAIDESTWADAPPMMGDLRIFYQKKKEIARVAFWGEPEARLLSGKLPPETFITKYTDGRKQEELIHDGNGKWELKSYYGTGEPYRRASLTDFRYEGELKDFYRDGSPKCVAPYQAGLLEGELQQWDEKGNLSSKSYRAGKPRKKSDLR